MAEALLLVQWVGKQPSSRPNGNERVNYNLWCHRQLRARTHLYSSPEHELFGGRRILTPESSEKFRAPGGPPSSRSDDLTTELLEALWRAGSKFNNYISQSTRADLVSYKCN